MVYFLEHNMVFGGCELKLKLKQFSLKRQVCVVDERISVTMLLSQQVKTNVMQHIQ